MGVGGLDLCCPRCRDDLLETGDREPELRCRRCQQSFPVVLGIPDLRIFPDPYIAVAADLEKGRRVAQRFADLDFRGLVEFYYSITPGVPPRDAQQYTRSVLGAGPRAEAALAAWEEATGSADRVPDNLLELGCGTAPLLAAASRNYRTIVGIDIAFRWLVVGKKRLAEAGLDPALVCACAEALPFRTEQFDRVVSDSVLEVVRDQRVAAREAHRVLRPGGRLFLATPNRFSLGPDPHVGLWAGGWLPRPAVEAYVRRKGGIPPQRRLLSRNSLNRLLRSSGFDAIAIFLPDVPVGQRAYLTRLMNLALDWYHRAKRWPITRHLLFVVGPLLYAVARKPGPGAPGAAAATERP